MLLLLAWLSSVYDELIGLRRERTGTDLDPGRLCAPSDGRPAGGRTLAITSVEGVVVINVYVAVLVTADRLVTSARCCELSRRRLPGAACAARAAPALRRRLRCRLGLGLGRRAFAGARAACLAAASRRLLARAAARRARRSPPARSSGGESSIGAHVFELLGAEQRRTDAAPRARAAAARRRGFRLRARPTARSSAAICSRRRAAAAGLGQLGRLLVIRRRRSRRRRTARRRPRAGRRPSRAPARGGRGDRAHRGGSRGAGRDERAAALLAFDQALLLEALVDGAHGVQVHADRLGQLAQPGRRWPARTALADARAQRPRELHADRHLGVAIDRERSERRLDRGSSWGA